MGTADIITAYETCARKGVWVSHYQAPRMTPADMLYTSISAGLAEDSREDYGEVAGEKMMELAETPGMETKHQDRYGTAIHHAALADIIVSAIRNTQGQGWERPGSTDDGWVSGCFLSSDGDALRRVTLVSSWSEERHYAEVRSWRTWGEIAAYNLPMQQIVVVIGPHREGRRHSPWSKGILHPKNRQLRFRKRSNNTTTDFKDSWERVWREEHAEVERRDWLQAMLTDDVLNDVLFTVDVPIPQPATLDRLRRLASLRLKEMQKTRATPPGILSGCEWPTPCQFRSCCYANPERTPQQAGFITISASNALSSD